MKDYAVANRRRPIDNRPQITNLSPWAFGPPRVMKTRAGSSASNRVAPIRLRSLGQWRS